MAKKRAGGRAEAKQSGPMIRSGEAKNSKTKAKQCMVQPGQSVVVLRGAMTKSYREEVNEWQEE